MAIKIFNALRQVRAYWTLIKSLQTGLLLVTGLAGYMSARCPVMAWPTLLALAGSMALAVSGSTVFNMVYDRDIDARMKRSCQRPLPAAQVSVREALSLGIILSGVGVSWAFALSPLYGLVILAGLFFDAAVYTLWLKRRTAFSILIGGLAGGMPVLAGRTLGSGRIDAIGILLALAVLLWIPTHVMTFTIRYEEDYRKAGIPTFPSTYGVPATRVMMTLSSVGAAVAVTMAAVEIGLTWGYLGLLAVLTAGLFGLAVASIIRPSERTNLVLFKYASLYMLSSMSLIAVGTVW